MIGCFVNTFELSKVLNSDPKNIINKEKEYK
jgi:hypothetical protein